MWFRSFWRYQSYRITIIKHQQRLRLVFLIRQWLKQHSFQLGRQCIQRSWMVQWRFCRFLRLQCMDIRLQWQYPWPWRIWRHYPLNHHCIRGFHKQLSNQLTFIQRRIRGFHILRMKDLLMNRWLRKPSMIHIILSSWLVWRHLIRPSWHRLVRLLQWSLLVQCYQLLILSRWLSILRCLSERIS